MVTSDLKFYRHQPGTLSRWSVIDVGLKCTHSCKFCYYSYLDGSDDQFEGMRHAKFHETGFLKDVVFSLSRNGFLGFDVTGGEPTLHPGLTSVIRHATDLGIASRVITLGQFLMKRTRWVTGDHLLDDLLNVGVTNFLFSTHATDEETFRAITGESWSKLYAAMCYLDERGFQYTTNTTVFEDNYRKLPSIAREIKKHAVYLSNFILMNAYYQWAAKGRAAPVQAKYSDVHPYLTEAVSILEDAGIGVNIRYAPMCAVHGMEKNMVGILGVRHDPYEWMNRVDHYGVQHSNFNATMIGSPLDVPTHTPARGAELVCVTGQIGNHAITVARGDRQTGHLSKIFTEKCNSCGAMSVCDGIDGNYVLRNGDGEFTPYAQTRGAMLDESRLAYDRPFFVKLKPDADMRAAMTEKELA